MNPYREDPDMHPEIEARFRRLEERKFLRPWLFDILSMLLCLSLAIGLLLGLSWAGQATCRGATHDAKWCAASSRDTR